MNCQHRDKTSPGVSEESRQEKDGILVTGLSLPSHQYNLVSLCQTCLSTAFRQQFTLFPCLHFPSSLPWASGPHLKPSCTETRHIFPENQALPGGNFSTSPPTSTGHLASPTLVLLSLPPPPPKRVFAAQKNH